MATTYENTTKLCSWGTSRAVRISKPMCDEIGIDIGTDLRVRIVKDDVGPYLILRPEDKGHRSFSDAPYLSMDELFLGYAGAYQPTEPDWGADIGAEVIE
jgi:antitoxin MazE